MSGQMSSRDVMYSLVDGLLDVAAVHGQLIASVLAELALTESQANALWRLRPEAPRPMRELAIKLNCDPSTLTDIIDGLESKGLAQRSASRTDRRVKLLSLTDKGVKVRRSLINAITSKSKLVYLTKHDKSELLRLLTLIRN